MFEIKLTDGAEIDIFSRSLVSHVFHCQKTLKLHNETKKALGDAAISHVAAQAEREMEAALTMLAKYFQLHLANSKFYCLDCAPKEGEEFDRMTEADFAWSSDCSNCGKGAFYFVSPKVAAPVD